MEAILYLIGLCGLELLILWYVKPILWPVITGDIKRD